MATKEKIGELKTDVCKDSNGRVTLESGGVCFAGMSLEIFERCVRQVKAEQAKAASKPAVSASPPVEDPTDVTDEEPADD